VAEAELANVTPSELVDHPENVYPCKVPARIVTTLLAMKFPAPLLGELLPTTVTGNAVAGGGTAVHVAVTVTAFAGIVNVVVAEAGLENTTPIELVDHPENVYPWKVPARTVTD